MSVDGMRRLEAEQRDAMNARASVWRARELVDQCTRENEALHALLADAATTLHEIAVAAGRNRKLRPIEDAASGCLERISQGGLDD